MAIFRTRDGSNVHYFLRGSGPTIVLTPGGREPARVLAPLADKLTQYYQVLTWDRRNCGAADLYFDLQRTEQTIWSEDLIDLMAHLNLTQIWLAGGSAGCRVSLNTVLKNPAPARGLILWSASGGEFAGQFLGFAYHGSYINAAQTGGMQAVARTPFFAERIAENPNNKEYLLNLDVDYFIAVMRFWSESFKVDPAVPLVAIEGDLTSITVPTLIFTGNDDIHDQPSSERLAAMIASATLVGSPWSGDEFKQRFLGQSEESVFSLYPRLVLQIKAFIDSH